MELTNKKCKRCPDPYYSDEICEYCNGTQMILVPYPDEEDNDD
jgi:hypothetical protein